MLAFKKKFFQHCDFETLVIFPTFWDFLKNSQIKNENVQLVSILFQPHCLRCGEI
jgi:hypothetical protein